MLPILFNVPITARRLSALAKELEPQRRQPAQQAPPVVALRHQQLCQGQEFWMNF